MEVANKLLLISRGLDMPPSAIYFSMWFPSLVRSCYYRCANILLVSVKYLKSMRMASHICGYLQNCYLMWRLLKNPIMQTESGFP